MRATDNHLIIHKPEKQTFGQRFGNRAMTVFFWFIYLYLWRPALFLVAWFFGVQRFSKIMIEQEGYRSLFKLLGIYGGIILLIGLLLESWSLYNLVRFRGKENRRLSGRTVSPDQVAEHFSVDPDSLQHWQQARFLTIHHLPDGSVSGVEVDHSI